MFSATGNTHQFSNSKPIKNLFSSAQRPELNLLSLLIEEKKQNLTELISHELPITETKYTTLKKLSTGSTVSKPVFRIGQVRCGLTSASLKTGP